MTTFLLWTILATAQHTPVICSLHPRMILKDELSDHHDNTHHVRKPASEKYPVVQDYQQSRTNRQQLYHS
jgi:hypothetical protein